MMLRKTCKWIAALRLTSSEYPADLEDLLKYAGGLLVNNKSFNG